MSQPAPRTAICPTCKESFTVTAHHKSLNIDGLQFDCLECMAQHVESLDPNSGVDVAYNANWAKQKREAQEETEVFLGKYRLSKSKIEINTKMTQNASADIVKNGSRCRVLSLSEEEVKVRFTNGKELAFKPPKPVKKYPYTSDGDGVRVAAEDFNRLVTELGWDDKPARETMAEYMRRSNEEDGIDPDAGPKLDLTQPPMMCVSMKDLPLEEAEKLAADLRAKGHNATLFDPEQNKIKDLPDKLLDEISLWLAKKQKPGFNQYAVIFEGADWNAPVDAIIDAFQYDSFCVESNLTIPSAERKGKFMVFTLHIHGEFLKRIKQVQWAKVPPTAKWLVYLENDLLQVLPIQDVMKAFAAVDKHLEGRNDPAATTDQEIERMLNQQLQLSK